MRKVAVRDEQVHELLAKQAITDAIYAYCRGEDRHDAVLSTALWHSDGTAFYGHEGKFFSGPASQWSQVSQPGLARYLGSSHQVTNILIEVDGDRAVSESYVTVRLWNVADGQVEEHLVVGRYLDTWSLREQRWAVDHRRFVFDLSYRGEPATQKTEWNAPWESNPNWFEGRQGRTDPSYELMAPVTERLSEQALGHGTTAASSTS